MSVPLSNAFDVGTVRELLKLHPHDIVEVNASHYTEYEVPTELLCVLYTFYKRVLILANFSDFVIKFCPR